MKNGDGQRNRRKNSDEKYCRFSSSHSIHTSSYFCFLRSPFTNSHSCPMAFIIRWIGDYCVQLSAHFLLRGIFAQKLLYRLVVDSNEVTIIACSMTAGHHQRDNTFHFVNFFSFLTFYLFILISNWLNGDGRTHNIVCRSISTELSTESIVSFREEQILDFVLCSIYSHANVSLSHLKSFLQRKPTTKMSVFFLHITSLWVCVSRI